MTKNIQIVSLNIWHGNLKDDLLSYIGSKKDSTAVFCFQEIDAEIYQIIRELLDSEFNLYYAQKISSETVISTATFVRKELKVVETRTLLSDIDEVGLGLLCVVDFGKQGSFAINNIHGWARPGHKFDTEKRLEQSKSLLESTKQNQNATNIFMGDFNLMPETESVKMFIDNGFRNLISDFNIPTTRNEAVWSRYPENKQLFADYTFVQQAEGVDYDFLVEENEVSDHLPMTLELIFE